MVEGERMMLVDNRQRRYLIELAHGQEFHSGMRIFRMVARSAEGAVFVEQAQFMELTNQLNLRQEQLQDKFVEIDSKLQRAANGRQE